MKPQSQTLSPSIARCYGLVRNCARVEDLARQRLSLSQGHAAEHGRRQRKCNYENSFQWRRIPFSSGAIKAHTGSLSFSVCNTRPLQLTACNLKLTQIHFCTGLLAYASVAEVDAAHNKRRPK
jgi:hypothetical protein